MDQILIYIHAITGSVALISGMIALIAKKGRKWHILTGQIFFYAMIVSALLAIIISVLPHHENLFLLCIGVLTIYFLVLGISAIRCRSQQNLKLILRIAGATIILAGAMLIGLSFGKNTLNVVALIFGVFGVVLGITDFVYVYRKFPQTRYHLPLHISKITGGYIASVTAFIVVNQIIPGIIGWILPGILGGIYIAVQTKRMKQS